MHRARRHATADRARPAPCGVPWAGVADYAPSEIIEEHEVFLINRERMNIQDMLVKKGFAEAAELIPDLVDENPYKHGNPYETARERINRILGKNR